MAARQNILQRIRGANRRGGEPTPEERETVLARLREHPRGPLPTVPGELKARFGERCIALQSTLDAVEELGRAPQAIARYLRDHQLPLSGVCWPQFAALDWRAAGLTVEARTCGAEDKVGITGAYCAIAETGTLMLLSGEHEHAATSLLPDTHVALVPVARIVRTMEDAWDLLRAERGSLPRQVNFVSGPSRTADIEMTLVMGAHGPFRVHIVLIGS
ncbi:MAG TPA: lactate utilization protein C [Burkholderiales bacterium]|jgi:L-lactate dehydrogenase complex protein LldG|nr:lactate utilization protein C [Burkholderiales bacterium]